MVNDKFLSGNAANSTDTPLSSFDLSIVVKGYSVIVLEKDVLSTVPIGLVPFRRTCLDTIFVFFVFDVSSFFCTMLQVSRLGTGTFPVQSQDQSLLLHQEVKFRS